MYEQTRQIRPIFKSYSKLAYSFENSMNQNYTLRFCCCETNDIFTVKNFLITDIKYRKQEDFYNVRVFLTGHVADLMENNTN